MDVVIIVVFVVAVLVEAMGLPGRGDLPPLVLLRHLARLPPPGLALASVAPPDVLELLPDLFVCRVPASILLGGRQRGASAPPPRPVRPVRDLVVGAPPGTVVVQGGRPLCSRVCARDGGGGDGDGAGSGNGVVAVAVSVVVVTVPVPPVAQAYSPASQDLLHSVCLAPRRTRPELVSRCRS